MNEWTQMIIAIATLLFGGGALGGFWVWARSQIVKMSNDLVDHRRLVEGQINVLKGELEAIHVRCRDRSPIYGQLDSKLEAQSEAIYAKIDTLTTVVSDGRAATARDIGRLEGKMDSLIRK